MMTHRRRLGAALLLAALLAWALAAGPLAGAVHAGHHCEQESHCVVCRLSNALGGLHRALPAAGRAAIPLLCGLLLMAALLSLSVAAGTPVRLHVRIDS